MPQITFGLYVIHCISGFDYIAAVPISGRKDELFQRLLQQLVLRLSRAHPFHCVPTLLLLANPRLGQQAAQGVNLRTKLEELEDRGKAAQKLLGTLIFVVSKS